MLFSPPYESYDTMTTSMFGVDMVYQSGRDVSSTISVFCWTTSIVFGSTVYLASTDVSSFDAMKKKIVGLDSHPIRLKIQYISHTGTSDRRRTIEFIVKIHYRIYCKVTRACCHRQPMVSIHIIRFETWQAV